MSTSAPRAAQARSVPREDTWPPVDVVRPLSAEGRVYVDALADDERPSPQRASAGWAALRHALVQRRQRTLVWIAFVVLTLWAIVVGSG